jgi:hypothetical protein
LDNFTVLTERAMSASHPHLKSHASSPGHLGDVGEVRVAIRLIFEAFESTTQHDLAVQQAKEAAVKSFSGEQQQRTLAIIDQLGRMMDPQYWKNDGRRRSYFLQ